MRIAALLTLTAVAGFIIDPAAADGINPAVAPAFTPSQELAVNRLIGQWLTDHPDAIRQALASRTDGGVPISRFDGIMGPQSADVTIVAFIDRGTAFAGGTILKLAALAGTDPKLRVIIKELPLSSRMSVDASLAAVAVRLQGEKPFHVFESSLAAHPGPVDVEALKAAVIASQVEPGQFGHDLDDPALKQYLKEVRAYADEVGIHGTPTFVIGHSKIEGTRDLDQLRQMIAKTRSP